MGAACATRTWTDVTSFALCPLVSGFSAFFPIVLIVVRRREIAHIPAACDTDGRVYAGHLASYIAHEGPDPSFARERQSVK
jgi:hypothetical protein